MAYYMYLGTMQIPIPPESITTTINNKNETIDLLGTGEVNILKQAGLTDISFKMLLPNSDYPFNESILFRRKRASYYINKLERMKVGNPTMATVGQLTGLRGLDGKIFQFIVVRMKPNGEMLQMTNMKVTLEDYKVIEEADNGFDCYAEISLKRWRDYGTKKVSLQTDKNGNVTGVSEQSRSVNGKVANATAKVSTKTTLQRLVKAEFGNTNHLFEIQALNKIAVPVALTVGQVVNMRKEGNYGG